MYIDTSQPQLAGCVAFIAGVWTGTDCHVTQRGSIILGNDGIFEPREIDPIVSICRRYFLLIIVFDGSAKPSILLPCH